MYNKKPVLKPVYPKSLKFFDLNIGSVNIQTGDEKGGGSKLYMVCKEAYQNNLHIIGLQEVRYRNSGSKIINLNNGEKYMFFWSGPKKRRVGGVGLLIKICKDISFEEPDVLNLRMIAINININGFHLRLVNAYSPTECDGTISAKDVFYRSLRKTCKTQDKNKS